MALTIRGNNFPILFKIWYNTNMSAVIQIQDDSGNPITSANFGAIAGGAQQQLKFIVANVGDQNSTSVTIALAPLAANDGIKFAGLTTDYGGNPYFPPGGLPPYSESNWPTIPLSFNNIAAGDSVPIWVNVAVLVGSSPAGNPRSFNLTVTYTGT